MRLHFFNSAVIANSKLGYSLGRFPFVRTGRSDLFVRKWYASVLRTVRTGSGQTGPAQGVGPISSHAPARVHQHHFSEKT